MCLDLVACFSAVFEDGQWLLVEPVMMVEVTAPVEFQGQIMASLNKRNAVITGQDATEGYFSIFCEVRTKLESSC